MALSLLPMTGAAAATDNPRDLEEACTNAPSAADEFEDYDQLTEEERFALDCLFATNPGYGDEPLFRGSDADSDGDREVGPRTALNREQMAAFIQRFLVALGIDMPTDPQDQFPDDEDSAFELEINQLAALEVIDGRPVGDETWYFPKENVRRDQLAKFINTALGLVRDQLLTADEDQFVEDCDDSLEPHVNALAEAGILQGVGNGVFDCDAPVTRGQLLLFLARPLDFLVENGEFDSAFGPTPPPSNETLAVTPSETAVNTVSDGTTANSNRGARSYTVSGLDTGSTYDIELHEAEDVVRNDDGTVTFRNSTPVAANNGVAIESVNGAVISTAGAGAGTTEVHNVTPQSNGTITFTIDSSVADRVIPVVNDDTDNDNTLDLASGTAPTAPTEPFGVGGEKEWIPDEAVGGQAAGGDQDILRVNKDQNYFLGEDAGAADGIADRTYYYDANDTFKVVAGEAGAGATGACQTAAFVSMATFEASLSSGDELDQSSIYSPDEDAQSFFCLEDLSPGAVTGVNAMPVDEDSIQVTWNDPGPDPDEFRVYRMQDATPTTCSNTLTDYTHVATVAGNVNQYTDNGLNSDTGYCYAVTQVVDGDESAISNTDGASTLAQGATAAPESIDAYVSNDTSFPGVVSEGDQWRIVFNKQMQPADATDAIVVRDNQGDQIQIDCGGTDANCQFNSTDVTVDGTTYGPGRVLTVTITNPAMGGITQADTNPTGSMNDQLEYPLTIVTQNGIVDTQGNAWTPADDPDNVIDREDGKTQAGTFTEATQPQATDADYADANGNTTFGDANGDAISVDYDEVVYADNGDTVTVDFDGDGVGDVTYTCGTNVACTGAGTQTITVTVTNAGALANQAVVLGTSQVTGSAGISDFGGNQVDPASYPEVIDAT